jgi:hypothetical protein
MRWLTVLTVAVSLGCGAKMETPDAGVVAVCPALTGEVIHQNDVTTSETWAGDGIVHHVTAGITVRPGATLTLAPCAVVKVANQQLSVLGTMAQPAKLVSLGTAAQPVLMTGLDGAHWGGWRNLSAFSTIELAWTTIENAGAGTVHGGSLVLRGDGNAVNEAIPVLKVDHVTITGGMGTGVVMDSAAAFTADSTELTVKGAGGTINLGGYPIELNSIAAGTIPTLHVEGNAQDSIRVAGSLYISRDLTLKNRGVPYYFAFDRVRVTDQPGVVTPTLTIEPGVEVRFDDYLVVGYENPGVSSAPGKLIALGTPSQHITLTSSKPTRAPGDWPGLFLLNAPGSRLENVDIDYAGGFNGISSANCKPANSSDNAAVFIGGSGISYISAPGDFVNVTVSNCASHGINSMWQAGGFGPILTGGFTFNGIAGCKQTRNRLMMSCGMTDCLVP